STQIIAFIGAGGLGLPDRDYYVKTDKKSVELREKYLAHVKNTFALIGENEVNSDKDAKTVMKIETALAKVTLTNMQRRDPYSLFHKMGGKALRALTPEFDYDAYFKEAAPIDAKGLATFNVTEPKFMAGWNKLLASTSLEDIKTYLRWHVAHAMSPYLSL